MSLEGNPLKSDIMRILRDKEKRVRFTWECYIKIRNPQSVTIDMKDLDPRLVDEKEWIFRPLKILNIDYVRKYTVNHSDEINITAMFASGLWYKVLQPYRDQLDMVIRRRPLKETTWEIDAGDQQDEEKFTCIPKISAESVAEGSGYDRDDRWSLDTFGGPITIDLMLLDKSTEVMRNVTTGGIFRRKKVDDVLHYIMQTESDKNAGEDGKPITTITIHKPDNEKEREHIVIPQGTKYFDVPGYIQFKAGGVYSAGLASYLQNKALYVFPPYNTKRFQKEEKTLTILRVPPLVVKDAERTWLQDGGRLKILATGDASFDDYGDDEFLDAGNGIRYTDSNKFMKDMFKVEKNKIKIERKKNNSEFVAKEIKDNNNVLRSDQAIHSNNFLENSKLSARFGSPIMLTWHNADASLLYPGMPVKIVYAKTDDIYEMFGVLIQVHLSVQLHGQGAAASTYTQTAALEIMVTKEINKDEFAGGSA